VLKNNGCIELSSVLLNDTCIGASLHASTFNCEVCGFKCKGFTSMSFYVSDHYKIDHHNFVLEYDDEHTKCGAPINPFNVIVLNSVFPICESSRYQRDNIYIVKVDVDKHGQDGVLNAGPDDLTAVSKYIDKMKERQEMKKTGLCSFI